MQQQMTCPKCLGQMRSYERSGVVVDQCGECRGIFLDRGELERLVDAENSHYRQAGPPQYEQPRHEQPKYDQRRDQHEQRYEQPRYEQSKYEQPKYDQHQYSHKKKKSSFFEELFD
ncbi:TFIIB-type zinc ribbon-containing protein [Hamadaea tsunoensis]|uniref:TFIIB-type zinc ribbon-containing protein n=1 Tax=Hamadaea tsunoensis TaxID=53368 RepID=UPI00041B3DA5|nr:zf-TFIIB domain-containing protein [Hamadaea tsunoensis]